MCPGDLREETYEVREVIAPALRRRPTTAFVAGALVLLAATLSIARTSALHRLGRGAIAGLWSRGGESYAEVLATLVPQGLYVVGAAPGGFVEPGAALRLAWTFECPSGPFGAERQCRGKGETVQAHQVTIFCHTGTWSGTVGDSGILAGTATSAIVRAELPPDSSCTAHLAIRFYGVAEPVPAWVAFRVALPPMQRPTGGASSAWQGGWIFGGTQLRGEFPLELSEGVQVASAIAYVSGVGCFSFSVNGQRLAGGGEGEPGGSFLDPGFSTVPTYRLLYRAFDVTTLLRKGSNVVGARLGQCKFGYLRTFCEGADAWKPACRAFVLQLNVKLSNGQGMNFTSSADSGAWRVTTEGNPVFYAHLFHGEMYDARREQPHWDEPDGPPLVEALWQPAVAYDRAGDLGALSLMTMPAIAVTERRSPRRIYQAPAAGLRSVVNPTLLSMQQQRETSEQFAVLESWRKLEDAGVAKTWVFDFGQNWAGFATLKVAGLPAGTRLTLRYGEVTAKDGSVFNAYCQAGCAGPSFADDMLGNAANQTDVYIVRGGGAEETYTPSFTYHGFRFIGVEGFPDEFRPSPDTLTALWLRSDLPTNGHVHFSDDRLRLLNSLQTAVIYTQGSNLHSIPTDCPQREKRGWMGDAQWTSRETSLNFRAADFYQNFARTFADTQAVGCKQVESGSAMGPRPAVYECCSVKNPSFGCDWHGVNDSFKDDAGSMPDVVPYSRKPYGGWPGDPTWGIATVEIPYQSWTVSGDKVALFEAYAAAKAFGEFLLRHADPPGGLIRFGYYGDWLALEATDTQAVSAFSQTIAIKRLAEMARELGHIEDAGRYGNLSKALTAAWHARHFDAAKGQYAGGSQTGYAMALYLDAPPTPELKKAAADALAKDLGLRGPAYGGVGSRIVFQALARSGRLDAALKLATRVDFPSLGYMLAEGPGTIWETWDARDKFDGSLNHPMYCGGIGAFMYEVAGLSLEHRHDQPALRISAEAAELAGSAEGSVGVVGGALRWSWRWRGARFGGLEVTVEVPHGAKQQTLLELPVLADLEELVEGADNTLVWCRGEGVSQTKVPGIQRIVEGYGAMLLYLAGGEYQLTLRGSSSIHLV